MPPPVVFVIGLLFDLLGYLPLGRRRADAAGRARPRAALAARADARRASCRSGWPSSAFAAGAAALGWALTALLSFRLLPVGPALFQAVLTVALYPALAVLFIRAHRTVADPERA